ncbi:hypothetical protein [Hymenobacter baengnokdamensis]|uniref:hypothetical protein n=1 Tax=Hymenobacter baengnokdamensis TaxID=2615203 RepID=UPI001247D3C8|nr:hypothetical protein [Hymenobacter baengnokdamensis]
MKPAAQDPLAQLTEIRAIMERSSRFLSLSGLSGVGAGVVALVGTAVGNYYLTIQALQHNYRELAQSTVSERWQMLPFLLGLSLAMIGAALLVAAFFTLRRTRREGLRSLWTAPARRLLAALLIPLAAGGLFCLKLYLTGAPELVIPGMLVFYGLALLNGSKYTLDEIKYLGLWQVGLGLVAVLLPEHGLLLFGLGFGLGHIFYGLLLYTRYERPSRANFTD